MRGWVTERRVEDAIRRATKALGGWAIKISPRGFRGLPDFFCLFPRARVVFVETKRPGEKPRNLQRWVHERLRGLGFVVLVLDTDDGLAVGAALEEALTSYG